MHWAITGTNHQLYLTKNSLFQTMGWCIQICEIVTRSLSSITETSHQNTCNYMSEKKKSRNKHTHHPPPPPPSVWAPGTSNRDNTVFISLNIPHSPTFFSLLLPCVLSRFVHFPLAQLSCEPPLEKHNTIYCDMKKTWLGMTGKYKSSQS